MNISDVPPGDLHAGKTRVRHVDSGAEGVFLGWAQVGWVRVLIDGEEQTFDWLADSVEVIR